MLTQNGGQKLRGFSEKNGRESVCEVTRDVWFVSGLGHSNAVFIEGASSIILIDTLDTLERGKRLSEIIWENTGKKVRTILYTHAHPDHRGGAGAFQESAPEIIAFEPKNAALKKTELLQEIQARRGERQFGYALTDAQALSQGIGPREGITRGEHRAFVPPTCVYRQDRVIREIDGLQIEMLRLPGEAEEEMMIWLPQQKVLCCGDNYFGCFPNLYPIRGGAYRDLGTWIDSIDTILSYRAQYLLPGHLEAVSGEENIQEVLGNFRNAIDHILTKTLEGMNEGKSAEQLACEVSLPEKYTQLPYLAEHYGCLEWSVRAVYTAYLGWFDGNPTHLHPLPPQTRAQRLIALAGGRGAVLKAARDALEGKEYQWCLELCDLLLSNREMLCKEVRLLKACALEKTAEYETSANGRHYYLSCAEELRAK